MTFWPDFAAGRPTMPGFSVGVGCSVTPEDVDGAVVGAAAAGADVAAGAAPCWLHAARTAPAAIAVNAPRAPRRVSRVPRRWFSTRRPPLLNGPASGVHPFRQ